MNAPAVLLFRGRGVISALLRWQTRGAYSHAAILRPDGKIVESWQGKGVRVKALTDWSGVDRYEVPGMTPEQWTKAIEFAQLQVGKAYDYWAIIRFISRTQMPDNEKWFCSELVFDALRYAGVNLFERIKGWSVSPGLLSISPRITPYSAASVPPDQ